MLPSVMNQLNELADESSDGDAPKKKRKRRTKAEIEAARANESRDDYKGPTVDKPEQLPPPPPAAKADPAPEPAPVRIGTKSIDVPISSGGVEPAFRLHLDLNLNGDAAKGLRRVARGLSQTEATLSTGRYVTNNNDAVRWILEQLTAAE